MSMLPRNRGAWLLLAAAAALVATACNNSPSPPAAGATIGAEGGSVEVTTGSLVGAAIEIPAGALTEDVYIAIYTDRSTSERATDLVGPGVRFSPTERQLAADATFSIPFDPDGLPVGTVADDLAVSARLRMGGEITAITPTSVDMEAGLLRFATDTLATCWVTAPTAFERARYFVLGDGNRYEFDGGIALDVSLSTTEPGLEGREIWRYLFTEAFFARTGTYLEEDPGAGALLFVGQFDAPQGLPAMQEIAEDPFALLLARERVGDERFAAYEYLGYEVNLPNPPAQRYDGVGTIAVGVIEERAVSTPAGEFDPTLVIEFEATYSDSRPQDGAARIRLWLARDVGPVMFQRGDGAPQGLIQALVDGKVIRRH